MKFTRHFTDFVLDKLTLCAFGNAGENSITLSRKIFIIYFFHSEYREEIITKHFLSLNWHLRIILYHLHMGGLLSSSSLGLFETKYVY